MKTELIELMKTLKANKKNITRQQFRTIRVKPMQVTLMVQEKDCINYWIRR